MIIPTYNRAQFLPRAVATVLAQTESDWELIIVDDGSTDDTTSVADGFADPRCSILPVPHGGISRARNSGIAHARGEWIAFLDDDDEWSPTYLERQLACAATIPAALAVYCVSQSVHDSGRPGRLAPTYTYSGDLFAPMCRHGYPRMSATMIRRSAYASIGGFRPETEAAEDCDLLMRLALQSPFVGNPEVLMIRHEHGGDQLSHDAQRARDGFAAIAPLARRSVTARGGQLAWMRWLRWHLGEAEITLIASTPTPERRNAAAAALHSLATELPWSLPVMARPALMWAVGAAPYARIRAWYRSTRRLRD